MRLFSVLACALALAPLGCAPAETTDGEVAPPTDRVTVDIGDSPAVGPADAPVVMVEFGDFECPYCGEEEPVLAQIREHYGARLRFVFKQFPLSFHEYAELAAEASLAANAQGKFWEYHDALYANQSDLTRSDLEGYAADLGLDTAAFGKALDDHAFAAAAKADYDEGLALGVDGTPSFFINGRLGVGALSYDALAAAIDEELAQAK